MSSKESKKEKAREVIDILEEISVILNTQLDRTQLSLCVSLMENGVNPEALAVSNTSATRVAERRRCGTGTNQLRRTRSINCGMKARDSKALAAVNKLLRVVSRIRAPR
jgi:mitotic-spindle organizing protein 1